MKEANTFQFVLMGVFGLFALIGLVYFATGGGTTPDPDQVDYGVVTMWGTVPERVMRTVLEDVELKIDVEYVQKSEVSMREEMLVALASNTGPDLVILPPGSYVDYKTFLFPVPYDTQNSANLDERMFRSSFTEQAEMYLGAEGIYAVPLFVDPMVMYWNRNIFASNSVSRVPTLWEAFKVLTPKMTIRDDEAAIVKATLPFGEYVNVTHAKDIISMLIMQAGAPVIDSNKGELTVNVNQPVESIYPGTEAVEYFIEFSNPSLPTYNWNRSLPDSKDMFIAGDTAVYFGYASEIPEVEKTNPHLNFDVAMVPQRRSESAKLTYGRMSGIAILNNSDNKSGAFQVLALLSGVRGNDTTFLKILTEELGLPPAHRALLETSPADPYLAVFYDSANISKSWPDPDPDESDRLFENAIEGALSNRYSVNVAISGLERQLEQLVNEYVRSNK
jgi:ABC-type glycerol-3-phosphate transport system substrate-binding protein